MKSKIIVIALLSICLFNFAGTTNASGLCDLKITGVNEPGTYTVTFRIFNITQGIWATGVSSPSVTVYYGNNPSTPVYLDIPDSQNQYRLIAYVTFYDGYSYHYLSGVSGYFSSSTYYSSSIPVTVTVP